jgi:uncharacterized protein (TIGR03118 family)
MSFHSWVQNLRSALAHSRGHRRRPRRSATHRPYLVVLEDRTVLSGYQQINLVGYQPGLGHFTDPNLNGWGMTSMPDGSFCVSNAFTTGLATFYDRSGHVLPQTITVPSSSAPTLFGKPGSPGHPTGVVYNPTSDFVISEGDRSAPARLIFDTIDGTISGWNPEVNPTHAIVIRDTWAAGNPAVYTGLEIGQDSAGDNVLYAADFLGNRVEMLNGSFSTITSFTDPSVPSFADGSFRAWSVQAVNDKLYVTFASLQDFDGGVVDVFDTEGHLLTPHHFAANGPGVGGPLQNPWGITQAPANFGAYSNDLLVGNVAGAGNINVFDPATGAYLGKLRQPDGAPIAITGLWDLEFGDGTPDSGKTNQLFFDAGPNAPGVSINGLFGVIHAAGDQDGNGGGAPVRGAADVRRLPRASDLGGSGLSKALPIVVLGQRSGAVLSGVQAPPATSPGPAPAAGTPSTSATGSSQAVPLASTPPGPAPGVSAHRVRDQAFADLEGTESVALAPTADPLWTW